MGIMRDEKIRRVKKTIQAVKETFDWTPEMEKRFNDIISEFDLAKITKAEIIWAFNYAARASQKTVSHKIPKEMFATQKEADDNYFIPRGGRCIGEEEYWLGTVNPVLAKWMKKDKLPTVLQKARKEIKRSS